MYVAVCRFMWWQLSVYWYAGPPLLLVFSTNKCGIILFVFWLYVFIAIQWNWKLRLTTFQLKIVFFLCPMVYLEYLAKTLNNSLILHVFDSWAHGKSDSHQIWYISLKPRRSCLLMALAWFLSGSRSFLNLFN